MKKLMYIFLFIFCILFFTEDVFAKGPLDGFKVEIDDDGNLSSNKLNTHSYVNEDGELVEEEFNATDGVNKIYSIIKGVIYGLSGIAMLTSVVVAILQFIKLGGAGENARVKSEALSGLLHCAIATALGGAVVIITAIASNLLKE